jgi:hypothetical protein
MDDSFKFFMPAQIEKAKDGEWRVRGLASTEKIDQQGEILVQKGMDLTPVDQKRGFLNFEHKNDPANLVGSLDAYRKTPQGLYIEGRLFKNHERAKHIYGIMSSLTDADRGRAGLSVEGQILERDPQNSKIIRKCRIKNVAITFNPVNTDTFVDIAKAQQDTSDLMKSMSAADVEVDTSRTFSAEEVVELLQKALSTGGPGALQAPATLTGGEALKVENSQDDDEAREKKPKKVKGHTIDNGGTENGMAKSLKPLNFSLCKSHMFSILNNLQALYPEFTRSEIWECVKDRFETKFPELKSW